MTQIDKAFGAMDDFLGKHLNPPLEDESQKSLKEKMDAAFDTLLKCNFAEKVGEPVECEDVEMINVVEAALYWYSSISSAEEAIKIFNLAVPSACRGGLERRGENIWVLTDTALEALGTGLSNHYRTLRFKK